MPRFAHLGLAVLGAALAVPGSARSEDAPPASSPSPAPASAPAATPATAPAPAPAHPTAPLVHKHFGLFSKDIAPCAKCAAIAKAKAEADAKAKAKAGPKPSPYQPRPRHARGSKPTADPAMAQHQHVRVAKAQVIPPMGLPEGSRITGCAHSSNGVCGRCKALLEMPGEVTMVAPGSATMAAMKGAGAPGRALASDSNDAGRIGRAVVASGEPEPIGVMRTNYFPDAQAGASMGMPAPTPSRSPMPTTQPGRGPMMGDSREAKPHILGHLFGISEMSWDLQDKMDEGNRRKRQKHAALSYDSSDSQVSDLPASMVFGRGSPR